MPFLIYLIDYQMKKSYILYVVVTVLAILILVRVFKHSNKKKTEGAKPVASSIMAECVIAKDTMIGFSIKAIGNLRANERVEMVSELPLRLISVHFREGSHVKKGELLFQLDDSEYRVNLKKVRAKLDLATETAKRNETLFASGGISQQTFDESVNNRLILEAEEEYLNVMIAKTQIRAPFSGIIGIRHVSEGTFLTTGTNLVVLEDLSRLKLDFTIPENYAGMISVGQLINYKVNGFPGSFSAVIEAINPSVNLNTGSLKVLAMVRKPDPHLKAGVSASITIESQSVMPAIYIPTQALIPGPGGYHVYKLTNAMAESKSVLTGIRTESMVEIVQGVFPGDSVLVTGFMKIRPGSRVKIIKVW